MSRMRHSWIAWVIAIVVAVCVIGGATTYNRLVSARERVDNAWAQVDNVLQRRADLIPNLVATVKGYAAHEQAVFRDVAEARSRLLAARTPGQASAANQGLDAALGRLLALSERYPDLKANQSFTQLQDELAGTENRIAVERRRYNDRVRRYNVQLRRLPTSIVARLLGFEPRSYFQASAKAREVPAVHFEG